ATRGHGARASGVGAAGAAGGHGARAAGVRAAGGAGARAARSSVARTTVRLAIATRRRQQERSGQDHCGTSSTHHISLHGFCLERDRIVNVNKRAVKQLPTPGDGKFAGLLGREFYTTGRQFFAAPASGGGTPSNFLLVSVDVYVNIHPVN